MDREGRRGEDPQNIGWFLGKQDWLELNWYGDTRQTSWGWGVISLEITISGVILDNLLFSFLFFNIQYVQKRLSAAGKCTAQTDLPQEGHSAKQFVDSWSNRSYVWYSSFVRPLIIYLLNSHSCSSQISVLYLERWAISSSNSLIPLILDIKDIFW